MSASLIAPACVLWAALCMSIDILCAAVMSHVLLRCLMCCCRSPRYGQHLTSDDIARIVQAPDEEIFAVTEWLQRNNIRHKVAKTRLAVEVQATVADIEALLHCELYLFQNKEQPQRTMVRKIGSMFLPIEVAEVVRFVFNIAGECNFVVEKLSIHRAIARLLPC